MASPFKKADMKPAQGTGFVPENDSNPYEYNYFETDSNEPTNQPTHQRFAKTAYQEFVQQPQRFALDEKTKPGPSTQSANVPQTIEPIQKQLARRRIKQRLQRQLRKKTSPLTLATATAAKARATAINTAAFSWMVPLWLFWQLPFAILSIVVLGAAYFVDTTVSGTPVDNQGFWSGTIGWIGRQLSNAVVAILESVLGMSLADVVLPFYLILTVLILGIGTLSLLFLYLQYTVGFLKPLDGQAAGLKIGLLLLAILGYAVPVANLFPWVFLWMLAVWFFPR